jgi:outer membrane receptor protein involved in Fe transport
MFYTGIDQLGQKLDNEKTLDNLDFLPSVNLVYSLVDDMNLRVSFNRTLARPSFKEKSNAQIFDPISKRTFIGNLDLEETHVSNYDVRWEYFMPAGQMISFSAYYKAFDGHIELVSFDTAPDNLKPRNSGKSDVYGIELEARKNINQKFSLGANASLVKSAVDLKSVTVNESGKNEYQLRLDNARTGEEIKETRPMAGQAPYVVNFFASYKTEESGLSINLAYNVQGETLNIVGSGRVSDVYTKPFNSLNLTASKEFGKGSRIQAGINNILSAERFNYYKSYGAPEEIYSIFKPGTSFSVKFAQTF